MKGTRQKEYYPPKGFKSKNSVPVKAVKKYFCLVYET